MSQDSQNYEDTMSYSGWIKLFLLHVAEVLKKLLPALAEKPRFVATAPAGQGVSTARGKHRNESFIRPSILDLIHV